MDWTLEDGLTSSDHNLIHVNVRRVPLAKTGEQNLQKYNLRGRQTGIG